MKKPPLSSQTDAQEDAVTAGQRKINLIWEYTQAFIAIVVILTNMATGIIFAIKKLPAGDYPGVLSSSLFLVIGFYFSRTNHQAIGGQGEKPTQKYVGR